MRDARVIAQECVSAMPKSPRALALLGVALLAEDSPPATNMVRAWHRALKNGNSGFSYRKKFWRSDWRRAPSKLGFSGYLFFCGA
jgi:hypothetical protein